MSDICTAEFRDINTITAEIRTLQRQTERLVLEYAIEVGRRLTEAKGLLPHGEWGKWLKEEVSFSQSTANNLMKIYEEYGAAQNCIFGAEANSQALGNLSYTKALRLLAIPSEEREEFAEKNDVENISSRELDRLIKEKQAAEKEKDDAKRRLGDIEIALDKAKDELAASRQSEKQAIDRLREAQKDVKAADDQAQENENKLRAELESAKKAKEKAEADAAKAKEAKKKAEEKLKAAKENPEIAPEVLEKLKAEAEEKAGEALRLAEQKLKDADEKLECARKELKLSAPDTVLFKHLFSAVQEDFNKLNGCLLRIKLNDPELADKLKDGAKAILNRFMEGLEK